MRLPEYVHEANIAGLAKALPKTKPAEKANNTPSIEFLANRLVRLPDSEQLAFWEAIPFPENEAVLTLANQIWNEGFTNDV